MQIRSPNIGGKLPPEDVRFIVVHYTVNDSVAGAVSWFSNTKSKASAHAVIGRDGVAAFPVPLNRIAWHAGRSSWKGVEGLNRYSIGVELVNWGPLVYRNGSYFPVTLGVKVPESQVFHGKHSNGITPYEHWQSYTEVQLERLDQFVDELRETFPNITDIVGHCEIAPDRKVDPGPALDIEMKRLKAKFASSKKIF